MIAVCMPLRDVMEYETEYALIHNSPRNSNVFVELGLPVDVARNKIAKRVQETDAEFVVWIDSDMVWQRGSIEKLIKTLDENVDLAIAYFCARVPFQGAMAWDLNGDQVMLAKPGDLIELSYGGFGMAAHRRELLDRVGPDPFTIEEFSEDTSFYKRVQQAGGRVVLNAGVPVAHMDLGRAFLPMCPPGRIVNGRLEILPDKRSPEEIAAPYFLSGMSRNYGPEMKQLHERRAAKSRGEASHDAV